MNPVQVSGNNLTYVYVILGISLLALAIAYALRAQVLAQGEGTVKMQEIATAIQEGAAAYLASCLLYTSPSPRDLSTSRMPSSA